MPEHCAYAPRWNTQGILVLPKLQGDGGNTMSAEITDSILTERQIKAGLRVEDDEDFVYLTTSRGWRIAVFSTLSPALKQSVQAEADKYLLEIDWQG
jgi:hypothetical protein